MAVTRLSKIKSSASHSINTTLKGRLDYIINKDKTNNEELVSAFECEIDTAYLEFALNKDLYEKITGNETKKNGDVLAYHLRQAFKPGEVTSELAHEIGIKLAKEFTKGNNQFVIATHVDKAHIHNHIIFNSTNLNSEGKFQDVWRSAKEVRKISDRLCLENNLSVVEPKNERGQHYKEWEENQKGKSWKQQIKDILDEAIKNSKDYDEFLKLIKSKGMEVKHGKHIAFKLEELGQQRFTRGKTLGSDYTEEQIKLRIEEKNKTRSKFRRLDIRPQKIKANLSNKNKKVYTLEQQLYFKTRNEKYKNVKDLAETILLLRNENIDRRSDINLRISELNSMANAINKDIKELENKSKSFNEVAKYLNTYNKYKDLYDKYESTTFNKKKFYRKNEGEILSFEHAKSQLEKLNVDLNTDIEKVLSTSQEFNNEIENINKDFKELQDRISKIRNAERKIDDILGNRDKTKETTINKDIER